MAFAYYDRLPPRVKAIYRSSDAVTEILLPRPDLAQPLVAGLEQALRLENRAAVELAAGYLGRAVTEMLSVRPAAVAVRAVRPRSNRGELHGLYTPGACRIELWMRTAQHRRVVAFRTFLRTLLHELGHHLDYEYLKLPDSLHTEGFFKRESSLVRQLAGGA